ncbi:hypothetical protein LNP18_06430 [Leuconostoc citreum]|uniref:hypothetical protein n=1 Tax=Leuconostoc citreum TaxID=33964 RepID=UPI00200A43D7|nr:hypothetical protein [Leuconostoc citreum]MCK8605740.1 hypothetical protein [Leuconostoc citreum]
MKKYFDKVTQSQWRTILYVLGAINLGFCLLIKWNMYNLVIGLSTIAVASTMKNK